MRNRRGITLVALIITIIILLILSGITIGQLTGNGIFTRAKEAKEQYQNAQENEIQYMGEIESQLNSYISGNRDLELTDEVKNYIDEKTAKSVLSVTSKTDYNNVSSMTKVAFSEDDDIIQRGSKFSINNGVIKIGAGVHLVKISAFANVDSAQQAKDYIIWAFKSFDYGDFSACTYCFDQKAVINGSHILYGNEQIIEVEENDVISVYVSAGAAATFKSVRFSIEEI